MPNGKQTSRPKPRRAPRRSGRASGGSGLVGEGPVFGLQLRAAPLLKVARVVTVDVTKPAADKGYWWNFSLADVPNSNEFTALFKEWKLMSVEVAFLWNPSSLTGTIEAGPRVFFANDPVTASTPASRQELLEQGCKQFQFNYTRSSFRVRFSPRVTQLVASAPGSGSTVNNAIMPSGTWLSCSQPSTGYGALVAWIDGYNTGAATGGLRMTTSYSLAFRGIR